MLVTTSNVTAEKKGPKLEVDKLSHEFGSVAQGSKVTHEFVATNVGDTDLVIKRLVPACGCTATSLDNDVIEPGATARIKVEFDTSGFAGEKVKTVRIFSNDTKDPITMLSMRGTVIQDVAVEPKRVFFSNVSRSALDRTEQKVTVKVREGSKAKIKNIRSFSKFLRLEEISGDDKSKTFTVGISPEASLGEIRERVVIEVSGSKASAINVPVFATVKGDLQLQPTTLSFGILEGSEEFKRSVKLENLGERKVNITSIESNNPALNVSYTEVKKGKAYVIQVNVDPAKVSKELRASVSIKTDHPDEKNLALSVYGILPIKG